ncbi:hypothetical protein EGM88_04360 [Aureibaculum marinum]|uniref:Aspartate racemase n=1 Tax=Aureibaculum marinum TaxID=2487930 RepID=A0A3N4NXY1_9FLAO|nr:aspartate/glutamate racemase family protein [Aureibaculum marinum]RPD99088.1 hypothetical protein EGM88_04360 [Aureibaculum marinum]
MKKTNLAVFGLGSRSTLYYIKELNRLFNNQKKGYSTCPFILLNADFNTINSLLPNPSEKLDTITHHYIKEIEKLDIEQILVPNITLHETIDRLIIHKKIIHPIHLTASKLTQNKWTKIVLFGSLHSMTSTYIGSNFKLNGIEVTLPSKEDMFNIDEFRKQVYNETETIKTIKNYQSIISKYSKNYPVVLACTELSIFKTASNNVLDMAEIQITEAIKSIL